MIGSGSLGHLKDWPGVLQFHNFLFYCTFHPLMTTFTVLCFKTCQLKLAINIEISVLKTLTKNIPLMPHLQGK